MLSKTGHYSASSEPPAGAKSCGQGSTATSLSCRGGWAGRWIQRIGAANTVTRRAARGLSIPETAERPLSACRPPAAGGSEDVAEQFKPAGTAASMPRGFE